MSNNPFILEHPHFRKIQNIHFLKVPKEIKLTMKHHLETKFTKQCEN